MQRCWRYVLLFLFISLFFYHSGACQPGCPQIYYDLTIKEGDWQTFYVNITIARPPHNRVVFVMPSWSPGGYMLGEYSKYVRHVQAKDADGKKLEPQRLIDAAVDNFFIWFLMIFSAVFTNTVKNDNRIVQRITNNREQGSNDREGKLFVQNGKHTNGDNDVMYQCYNSARCETELEIKTKSQGNKNSSKDQERNANPESLQCKHDYKEA